MQPNKLPKLSQRETALLVVSMMLSDSSAPATAPPELGIERKDALFDRPAQAVTAPHVAQVMRPIIRPKPQSGNRRGKR